MRETPITTREEKEPPETPSRREFIKTMAGGFFGLLAAGKIGRAEAFLEEAFRKEEKETGPRILIEIFYAPHQTREDAKGIRERIQESDVVIPEEIGWDQKLLSIYRGISGGKTPIEEYFHYLAKTRKEIEEAKDSFNMAFLEALQNSKKAVELIDVPRLHPLHLEIYAKVHEFSLNTKGGFHQLVARWKKLLQDGAELQTKREQYMLENLSVLKKSIAERKIPELAGKDKVKILLTLGSYHTMMLHQAKRSGEDATRTGKTLDIFRHIDEVSRRFIFGKEVNDTLIARTIFESLMGTILNYELGKAAPDSSERGLIERRIAESFEFDEIQ